jgi:hypothetical protein
MLEDIAQKVLEAKASKARNYPVNANRASDAAHACDRFLYHSRVNWESKSLISGNLQSIFDLGSALEKIGLRDLEDAGYKIIEQQRSFKWDKFNLTGHMDAKLGIPPDFRPPYPLEFKSMAPWAWEGYREYEFGEPGGHVQFLESKRTFDRKYPGQLMIYMLMDGNTEWGILDLFNKITGQHKIIWIALDYDYAESILKRLERVNEAVEAREQSAQTSDINLCARCDFLETCLPDIKRDSLEMIEDPELEEKLTRREELSPALAEYKALDKEIKKFVDHREKLMVGDFLITGKEVARKGYEVAESTYWQAKIIRLAPGETEVA